ncbi:MAG TPA: amidase [Thermomicrobiales bacterium]|nr:amidase [Thermomicrobiales bacterium]
MTADDLCAMTLSEAARLIERRDVSPVALTEAALDRIARCEPQLNAFITVMADDALAAARTAEAEIARGDYRGPLHGVPISLKDLLLTRGVRTTAGSRILANSVPDRDATVVRRLRDAGAVFIGKNNLLEFAYGEVHPDYGPSRNPWNTDYGTSGSSSGSGAAVAAGLGFASIGSDTGGSIRGPAAYCGIVGLKPTYGLVSRAGAFPLSWSCDHIGPMTRSVRDCALVLDAIAGYDLGDPTSLRRTLPSYAASLDRPAERPTIGIVLPEDGDGVTSDVRRVIDEAAAVVQHLGFPIVPVKLPHPEQAARALLVLIYAEASAIHLSWLRERADDYAPNTRERLELGAQLPATLYLQASRVRGVIVGAHRELFRRVDLLLLPVSPSPQYLVDAPEPEPVGDEGDRIKGGLRFTGPFNLTGQPAITVPCGATPQGLPIGVQLVARPLAEPILLHVAAELERAMTDRLPGREGNPLVV